MLWQKWYYMKPFLLYNKCLNKYHVVRKLTNETHICSCLTHSITKTLTAKRCLKRPSNEDVVPSKVCKTSLIQLSMSMQCIHERILILNIAFILFSPIHCDEVYDEDGCNDDYDGWAEDCWFGMF
jgi:hypothetical protein